jgi:hypothetical protein
VYSVFNVVRRTGIKMDVAHTVLVLSRANNG